MGSGCLRPAPAKGEIDIQTLDNMYQDTQQIKLPGSNCPYQTIEVHPIIKEKLMKKGQLRKLIDYLSSHRFKICDNLLHSFRIMTQSKTIHSKYVCLIMMNQLFSSLKSTSKRVQLQDTTLKTIQSQTVFQQLNGYRKPTNKSQISIGLNMKNSLLNERQEHTESPSMMLCQITSYKFEGIYFNIICHLLKYENEIYKLTLQNINTYCKLGKAFFNSEEQIQQILKILLYHIQIDDYLSSSISTYCALLQRVKESFYNKNINFLRQFILVWLSNQVYELPEEYTQQKEEISQNCEQIIENFIKKSIQGWNSCVIYQIIFQLLDQECFSIVQKIQNLIMTVTEQLDLKPQFYRGLVLHLLAYSSMPESEELEKVWQRVYPSQNREAMKRRYPNILESSSKINSLNIIQKWIFGHRFVDIIDLTEYSSHCLVYSFIFNLFSKNIEIKDKAIIQYISLYKKMRRKEKLMILDITLEQTQQQFATDQQIYTMLSICQKFIEKQPFLELSQNYSHTILPLKIKYKYENNVKVIELISTLVNKLTIPYFYCQIQNLCAFMFSFYNQIKEGTSTIKEKLLIVKLFKRYINALKTKNQSNIAVAFIEKVQNLKENSFYTFYDDLITYEVLEVLQPSTNFPHSLTELLKKMENCPQIERISLLETYVGEDKKFQIILKQRDDNYTSTVNILRKLFSKVEEVQVTTSVFMQIKSIMSGCSIGGDARQDKELDDVIDVMNNK